MGDAAAGPFDDRGSRAHVEGEFSAQEVALANRNPGMPLEALRHEVTPVGLHYLLSHFDIPAIDAEAWRLQVGGRVERPASIGLDELQRLPARTLRVTMECAGNGRGRMAPRYPSMPWMNEAVGTAEWTGTPLVNVLEAASPLADAVEVAFLGADRGYDRGVEHDYGRSLSLAHARSEDVLLVWAMNGAPLLPQHGYPCRLLVPGWYGMASVKWLDRIDVLDRAFDGYQQAVGYHYRLHPGDPGVPVTTQRVRSLMVPPGIPDWYTRERCLTAGRVVLHGRAWAGGGVDVTRVEVGIDDRWHDARVSPAGRHRYAWQAWHYDWQAEPGRHRLQCRAHAADGSVQPVQAPWNTAGMGNHSVQTVDVTVRAA